jgi:chromosome segregation ATPase
MATKEIGNLRTRLSWEDNDAANSLDGFKRDLQGLRSEMKVATSQGQEYNNSLKGLGQQSDILNRQLKTQKLQVAELRKRYEESVKVKGADDKATRRLAAEYNKAAAEMNKTEIQIGKINDAIESQTNPWKKLSEQAEQAGQTMQNVGERMTNIGQTLSASVTAPLIGLGTLAVETTREFREDLAKLHTNAKLAGVGIGATEKALKDLNAITGETDSNVEALSNLMATGMNDNQMLEAVEALSGAVIKFPDTLKIEGLADGLQETLATGKAIGPFAELLERMGVDLEEFNEGLAGAAKNGDEVNYVLKQLNKLDLSKVNEEFRETNKELIEAKDAQYDFQRSMAELGKKLEPIASRITEGITEIVDKFNELEPEVQDNILKFAGLAAAVGPVTMGLGSVMNVLGGLSKGFGGLADMLGKKEGAGLLGKIGMLAPLATSPVGLAIAGVGALGLGIYAVTKASEKNREEILNSLSARKEELDSLDETITRYEELQSKNKLSTDEVLRYMDILDELKNTKSEDAIKALTDEQQRLLEKSGLTNEEMAEFLGLNDQIIEKAPVAAKAISEEGNAYAGVLDELKKLTAAERERLVGDTYQAITEEMRKQEENLAKQKDLQNEIKGLETERTGAIQGILDQNEKIREKDLEIAGIREKIKNSTGEEAIKLAEKLVIAEDERAVLEAVREKHDRTVESLEKQIKKKQESLGETNKELKAFDGLLDDYAQMVLHEQGIVSEKGKANEALKKQQREIDTARSKLKELLSQGKIGTAEYQSQNKKLDEQQGKIDTAKAKLEQMNQVAGRTVYKDVKTNVTPSIASINRDLAAGVRKTVSVFTALDGNYRRLNDPTAKTVNIRTVGGYHVEPGYATGTDYHPGGPFIAGEEGFELGRLGNRWDWLELGRYNKPSGYEVFTHDESKKIIQALNRMPAYATGASQSGEASRVVNRLNQNGNQPIVINPAPIYLDNQLVGEVLFNTIDNKFNTNAELSLYMKGERR